MKNRLFEVITMKNERACLDLISSLVNIGENLTTQKTGQGDTG